jgi:predicted component of type VI protein secretion system
MGTHTLARRLVEALFASAPASELPRLVVVSGPEPGRELVLTANGRAFKLGRGEGCDWVIADEDVSREHAVFERDAAGVSVRDLGSKNGVDVGGERVAGVRRLRDGDFVRLGATRLRVVDPVDRHLRQMEAAGRESVVSAEVAEAGPPALGPSTLPSGSVADRSRRRFGRLPLVASTVATAALLAVGVVLALVLTL